MLDPNRPEFNIGHLVWVHIRGQLMFPKPVAIEKICEHEGKKGYFVEGSTTGLTADNLTLAATDDDNAARDAAAKDRQEQVGSPNADAMRQHLEHQFGGYLDGCHDGLIELAWTDTRPDKNGRYPLRHALMFGTDQIEELVDKAVQLNSQPICNVYVGAALRKPGTFPGARASREDVLALTTCYADLDEPGAAATVKDKCVHAKPTLVVVTGCHPHTRAQIWWRLSEPITDPRLAEALLKGMAHALGGDTSVTDPPRVMRLAGTIAWPVKAGRKPELTAIVPLKNPGQASYTYEHLAAVFPPAPAADAEGVTPPDGVKCSTNAFGFDGKVVDGRERYMLRTISACLIEFVGETGKAPTARELFDLAWPQYDRNVDFSRPGRRADEFADKCAYAVGRFLAGKIRGCETIEKTAELYRQRQQARAGQEEQARRAEAAANPADPVDLWAKFDPPTLPRGLLPQMIEDFAFDQGMAMGGDMSGIAVGALAVCAAAIPDSIQLQPKRHDTGWREAARLWVALVGPVSAMKSPILRTVARPLRAIDAEMARNNQRAMAEYNKLSKEDKQETDQPMQARLMMQDTTIEAAQEILKDSPNGVLCYQDELSGWFGSMDKYSGAKDGAKDRAFWLESYNGGSYTVSRIQRGAVFIENLSVSILGGIQPEPIRKLAQDSHDDGLLQRLTPIVLRPAVAGRDEKPSQAVAEYNSLIGKLHHINKPIRGGGMLEGGPTLQFDDGAMAIREELEKRHIDLAQCESINRKLAAHIGKFNGMFVRLCVVWHCVEYAGRNIPATIAEATARRVKGFLHGFLLPHALAFYAGTLGLSDDHDRLAAVAGYILARKLPQITNRDVQRGDRTMRNLTRRETEAIFEQLDALGWITRTPGPRPSDPPRWIVNPVVHQKFAERGKAEAERRERDRKIIGEMLRGTAP
jgi:Protein of unknown function (DUF3987)